MRLPLALFHVSFRDVSTAEVSSDEFEGMLFHVSFRDVSTASFIALRIFIALFHVSFRDVSTAWKGYEKDCMSRCSTSHFETFPQHNGDSYKHDFPLFHVSFRDVSTAAAEAKARGWKLFHVSFRDVSTATKMATTLSPCAVPRLISRRFHSRKCATDSHQVSYT